ncbi:MAG: methyl-accepting chemotaxis protein, partial [Pseudohongiellaceae bacterium]
VGIVITGAISYSIQAKHTKQEALETAAVLMEGAMAIRSYTVAEIRPLLDEIDTQRFLPQTVPAYSALKYVEKLQETYPFYSYKEAVINPTNLANLANAWELGIINRFRAEFVSELSGIKETAAGQSLYFSRPIQITNPDCLACHSTPDVAPASMIELYGEEHGFGWQLNEIIGAQIVSVPLSLTIARAQREIFIFMGIVAGTYLMIGIIMNLLLNVFVVKPVKQMSDYATEVSMGSLNTPELNFKGRDEISSLSKSFNRMQRSLKSAVAIIQDDNK